MKKRRGLIWLLGTLVVVGMVTAMAFTKLSTHEFTFLNRFHPLIQVPGRNWKGKTSPGGKIFIYFFDKANTPTMLEAMNDELTKKGFRCQEVSPHTKMVLCMQKVGTDSVGAVTLPPIIDKAFLRSLDIQTPVPEGGCAVYVIREPTWMERQVDAVKGFLHWD